MQRIGDPLHDLLLSLPDAWEIEYGLLSGKSQLVSRDKNTRLFCNFVFQPEDDGLKVSFAIKTHYPLDRRSRHFLAELEAALKNRNVQFVWRENGEFDLQWTVIRPDAFEENSKEALEKVLDSQVEGGQNLAIACVHVIKAYALLGNTNGRLGNKNKTRPGIGYKPSILTEFCLLEQGCTYNH